MLALIDFNGKENFEKWNQDLKQQIQYVYNLIQEESEYQAKHFVYVLGKTLV